MARLTTSAHTSVSDYLDQEDPDSSAAFEACMADTDGARKNLLDEVTATLGEEAAKQVAVSNVSFIEFDSGNVGHASAYFNADLIGPRELLEKFVIDFYGEGYDAEIEES